MPDIVGHPEASLELLRKYQLSTGWNGPTHGLYLSYLPPYSPELMEILWKQAKYFWRQFVGPKGIDLLNEVNSIMNRFGTDFTIRLA